MRIEQNIKLVDTFISDDSIGLQVEWSGVKRITQMSGRARPVKPAMEKVIEQVYFTRALHTHAHMFALRLQRRGKPTEPEPKTNQ